MVGLSFAEEDSLEIPLLGNGDANPDIDGSAKMALKLHETRSGRMSCLA